MQKCTRLMQSSCYKPDREALGATFLREGERETKEERERERSRPVGPCPWPLPHSELTCAPCGFPPSAEGEKLLACLPERHTQPVSSLSTITSARTKVRPGTGDVGPSLPRAPGVSPPHSTDGSRGHPGQRPGSPRAARATLHA